MATLGSLVVSLEANMARFGEDMNRASDVAQKAMGQIEAYSARAAESVKLMGMAAAGIAAGVSFNALIRQFDAVVESAAGLKDMAEKTGASVENLSGLASVAKLVGQDMSALEAGMTKFAKNLAGTSDESKGAAHALDTLGLKQRELRQMDTAESLKLVADKLAEYKDGVGKTALAQDLLGKSGAQLLPYLKDLAESGDLVAKTTAAQALQADEYEKNLKRLTLAKNALYKTIAMEMLPALNDFLKVMIDAKNETSGMQKAAKDLAADGSIRSWAESAALAAARVIDVFDGVVRTVQIVGRSLAGIYKDIETAGTVGMTALGAGFTAEGQKRIREALDERSRFVAAMNADIEGILQKPMFSARLAAQMETSRRAPPDAGPDKNLNGYQSNLGSTKAVKEQADDYDRLLKTIREKIAMQEVEISTAGKASAAEREYAKFAVDVREGHVKVTGEELKKLEAQWVVFLNQAETLQQKARALAYETARLSITDISASFGRDNQAQRDAMEVMPAAARELQNALRAVDEKGREAGRSLRRLFGDGKIDAEQYQSLVQELTDTLDGQKQTVADLLARQQALNASWEYGSSRAIQAYIDEVKNVAAQTEQAMTRAFKGMEDALVTFVTKGKLDFKGLADSIVADIVRIQVRQLITGQVASSAQGAGGVSGLIGNLLGSMSGGRGTPNTAAMAAKTAEDYIDSGGMGQGGGFLSGLLAMLPSFDVGTDYVPKDMVAKIHAGEKIVPAAQNKPGSGGLTQHITFNVTGMPDSRTTQQMALQAGLAAQRALARNG